MGILSANSPEENGIVELCPPASSTSCSTHGPSESQTPCDEEDQRQAAAPPTTKRLFSLPDLQQQDLDVLPPSSHAAWGEGERTSTSFYLHSSSSHSLDHYPLVSVCIPAYNAVPDFDECLESVLDQTYPNIEVSIHDDCSSDETAALLLEWQRALSSAEALEEGACATSRAAPQRASTSRTNDISNVGTKNEVLLTAEEQLHLVNEDTKKLAERQCSTTRSRSDMILAAVRRRQGRNLPAILRFRVSLGEVNRGEGFARNVAIKKSSGAYLCTMDADDVMLPDRISLQFAAAKKHPQAVIGGNFERIPAGSTHRYARWANGLCEKGIWLDQFREVTMIHPTWFMKREVFERAGGYHVHERQGGMEDFSRGCLPREELSKVKILRAEDVAGWNDGDPKWRSPLAADLRFVHSHLDAFRELYGEDQENDDDVPLFKVPETVLLYRHRAGASLCAETCRKTLMEVKAKALERRVLVRWCGSSYPTPDGSFTIWSAGRDGKTFFASLSARFQHRVRAFCDVCPKRVFKQKFYLAPKTPNLKIPIVFFEHAQPPFVICVAKLRFGEDVRRNLDVVEERIGRKLVEGRDYWFLC